MAPPNKSTKGKVSIAPPAQRRQTLTPTKKQSDSAVIPEAEAAKQMVENAEGQKASNFIDSAIDRAIEEGTPEAFIQLKDISDSQFQDWQNRHPESKIDADWLKTVRDNPYRLAISQLSPYDITLPPLPLWEFPKKLKEQPLEVQQQFFDRLNEEQVAKIPYQWADYWRSNDGWSGERLPELVVQQRKLTRYRNPHSLHDLYVDRNNFNRNQSTLNESTDSNALTNQEGYIHTRPIYNQNVRIPYYPNRIPESKKNKSNINNSPEKFFVRDALHNNEIRFDLPSLSFDVSGTFNPKLTDAKVGAGALTGLGVLAYPYLFSDNNEETLSEVPQKQPVIKSVSEPTLKQQYISQGKPYDSRPPQSYPVEEDLDASQIPLDLQETNSLARSIYDSVYSNTPIEAGSDNFTAPRELPANGETLDEYNSDSTPKSGVILASDDTTPANEPRVLNKPTNTRKPIIVNKPQKQVTPAPVPVSAESALVQNALSREDLAKRDRAFRNARYAALNANLAGREDALQRARYQSLMNSGLRGMSPSEAIKSGLLTPEQVYVLMRGPF